MIAPVPGLTDLSEFNLVAAMSARWTQITLAPDHLDWLRKSAPRALCGVDELAGMEFVHGSPRDEDEYLLNASTANVNFQLPGHADVIMFGHTHLQGGFVYRGWQDTSSCPQLRAARKAPCSHTLTLMPGERYLINPGSVGQPRDGDWRAAFALYEKKEMHPARSPSTAFPTTSSRRRTGFLRPHCRSAWRYGWQPGDSRTDTLRPLSATAESVTASKLLG